MRDCRECCYLSAAFLRRGETVGFLIAACVSAAVILLLQFKKFSTVDNFFDSRPLFDSSSGSKAFIYGLSSAALMAVGVFSGHMRHRRYRHYHSLLKQDAGEEAVLSHDPTDSFAPGTVGDRERVITPLRENIRKTVAEMCQLVGIEVGVRVDNPAASRVEDLLSNLVAELLGYVAGYRVFEAEAAENRRPVEMEIKAKPKTALDAFKKGDLGLRELLLGLFSGNNQIDDAFFQQGEVSLPVFLDNSLPVSGMMSPSRQ